MKNDFYDSARSDWGDSLDVRFYLAKRLSSIRGKKVLDVGCGQGLLLSVIDQSNEKFGVDYDGLKVQNAEKNSITLGAGKAKVFKASMYRLPFKSNFFDVVVCANVVPGADFPVAGSQRKLQRKMVSEAARVLKKGGSFFLTTPNNVWYERWRRSGFVNYADLDALLKPHFRCEVKGWNPFPPYPYFLPARVLRAVPGWFSLLSFLCEKNFFRKSSKFFYTRAIKI